MPPAILAIALLLAALLAPHATARAADAAWRAASPLPPVAPITPRPACSTGACSSSAASRPPGLSIRPLASALVYDEAADRWDAVAPMSVPRDGHTATLLPDGRVLVVGGREDREMRGHASVEVFDPTTGAWSATGAARPQPGAPHGGRAGRRARAGRRRHLRRRPRGDAEIAETEVYDPSTGAWTAAGALSEGRTYHHSATPLPDGRDVLVVGGVRLGLHPAGRGAAGQRGGLRPRHRSWSTRGLARAGRARPARRRAAPYRPGPGHRRIRRRAPAARWPNSTTHSRRLATDRVHGRVRSSTRHGAGTGPVLIAGGDGGDTHGRDRGLRRRRGGRRAPPPPARVGTPPRCPAAASSSSADHPSGRPPRHRQGRVGMG